MDEEALEEFRGAWCVGSEAFRRECLEQMEGQVGENHPGQTRLETAEAKAERIIAEELARSPAQRSVRAEAQNQFSISI